MHMNLCLYFLYSLDASKFINSCISVSFNIWAYKELKLPLGFQNAILASKAQIMLIKMSVKCREY